MRVVAEAAEIGNDVVDLLVGEQLAEGGHDLREAVVGAAVDDGGLVGGVDFGSGLVAGGKVREAVGAGEDGEALVGAFAVRAVAGNATAFVDDFAGSGIGRLLVVEGLGLCRMYAGAEKQREQEQPREDCGEASCPAHGYGIL